MSMSTSSNGIVTAYKHPETNILEYVTPTKKASDHSISQLISSAPSNHSPFVPTMKPSLAHSSYDNTTITIAATATVASATTSHALSMKTLHGSSSKPKIDGQHRPQSSSNGSNNNNFLYNNNNSSNKHTNLRPTDNSTFIDLCDTDDGETTAKRPKPHKHKHNKKSKESVGNSIPVPNTMHMLNQMQPTAPINVNPSVSEEVDHNQIIHDLKVNRSFLRKYFDLQL